MCKDDVDMNLTIEHPSTLIKVNMRYVKSKPSTKMSKQSQQQSPTLDFYTLTNEIEGTRMFNSISTNNCKSSGTKTCTMLDGLSLMLASLSYDVRIKHFDVFDEYAFVYFFCIPDAISFYKQYFNMFELSFCMYNGWTLDTFDVTFTDRCHIIYHQNDEAKIDDVIRNNDECKDVEYGKKRFENKVMYFNQLKSEFSKIELQKFLADLGNCDTSFVFENAKKLSVGCKSNKVMQEAIKIMSGIEIDRVLDCLEYDIVPIAATKHGAYTVQTLLNYATNKSHRKLVSKYFRLEGGFLLSHDIGNYTFQLLLGFDLDLVNELLVSHINDVVSSELGLKVFKRCIEFINFDKEQLMKKISELDNDVNLNYGTVMNLVGQL